MHEYVAVSLSISIDADFLKIVAVEREKNNC